MTKISEQSGDNGFLADELGSDPSTPPAGTRRIYPKADGWYEVDDAGAVTGPFGTGGAGNTLASTLVRRTSSQNVDGSGTDTPISFDTEDEDTDSVWAIGTPTKLVIPAGLNGRRAILFGGGVFDASTSGNYRQLSIKVGGSALTPSAVTQVPDMATGFNVQIQVQSHVVTLATAAEYELYMRIDATGIGVSSAHFGLYTVD